MVKKYHFILRLVLLYIFLLIQFVASATSNVEVLTDSLAVISQAEEMIVLEKDSFEQSESTVIELELEDYNEIDKLVVNNSKTKAGRDFYDLFMKQWNISGSSYSNYTIIITEKPYRLTITQIEIEVNDQLVFNSTIQPRYSILETSVAQAVSACSEFLANYELIMKLLENEDQDNSDY